MTHSVNTNRKVAGKVAFYGALLFAAAWLALSVLGGYSQVQAGELTGCVTVTETFVEDVGYAVERNVGPFKARELAQSLENLLGDNPHVDVEQVTGAVVFSRPTDAYPYLVYFVQADGQACRDRSADVSQIGWDAIVKNILGLGV